MSNSPATGERNAVRGYRWQYDQLASLVYDALIDDTFLSLRLTDPSAGTVDDLVLVTTEGTRGHQFKSEEPPGAITFNDLIKARKTRSGGPAPSWCRGLAAGWLVLEESGSSATVSLITNQWPSVNDHLAEPADPNRPPSDNFATFMQECLGPMTRGQLADSDVHPGWRPALERLREASGLEPGQFENFLTSLRLELATSDPLRTTDTVRRRDIKDLSDALFRKVSEASDVVVLDRPDLLAAVGWTDRVRLRSSHAFPVDLDTYEPLSGAVMALDDLIAKTDKGYLAVVGPPGSGKSTLLTLSLAGSSDRVIRYYAYVPGPGTTRTRMEGRGFLHDIVLLLERATNARGHLLERSDAELREALVELLDVVSAEYKRTGVRTLIVVDGLDHVERDLPGTSSLLHELPRPDEVPDGVVMLVGSRTLTPLRPEARQHIEETNRMLDLDEYRLPHDSVLTICRRVAGVSELGAQVHEKVAQLAVGHPLSLGYLINMLKNAADADQADQLLASATKYDGDVAQQYRAIWDSLVDEPQAQELLAVLARLRVAFTTDDLSDWFEARTVRIYRDRLTYLFRGRGSWQTIFHDSFRQFLVSRSNTSDLPPDDPRWDAVYHGQIVKLCQRAQRLPLRWEELYHRYRAGEDVLEIASMGAFRRQVTAMRSPEAIREDLGIVSQCAADKRLVLKFVEITLAMSEAESRWSALEHVDLAAALLGAGLTADAVAYAGVGQGRQVPLAQAYRLAARLGLSGDQEGRRVFDAVEPAMFDDADFLTYSGHSTDIYEAWAAAAPFYRPLARVLAVASGLHPGSPSREGFSSHSYNEDLVRCTRVAIRLVDSLSRVGKHAELGDVDDWLAQMLADHHSGNALDKEDAVEREGDGEASAEGDGVDLDFATDYRSYLVDVRLRIRLRRLEAADGHDAALAIVDDGLSLARSEGLHLDTLLAWAEVALRFDRLDATIDLLDRSGLDAQLDTRDLGYSMSGVLTRRFRYWRLRHRLDSAHGDLVLSSIPPDDGTPAGNSIDPGAYAHTDMDAIKLAYAYDEAVRTLAASVAAADSDAPYDSGRIARMVVPMLDIGRPSRRGSATRSGLASHRGELLRLIIDALVAIGPEDARALAQRIESRIEEEPERWPIETRLELARRFHDAGVAPGWYQATLVAAEQQLASGDLDLTGRLERAAELSAHHAGLGRMDEAQRLARMLLGLSFGVGYRKDHQFDQWVDRFGRAVLAGLSDPVGEATALAQLLAAAEPMTEGAPGEAAASLPSALAERHPGAAAALYEYLVRLGTGRQLSTLAKLIEALCPQLTSSDTAALYSTADFVTDVLVRGSNIAYSDTAKALVDAASMILSADQTSALVEEIASRIRCEALPTTRPAWLRSLGLEVAITDMGESEASGNNWGGLTLADGTELSATAASKRAIDAASLIELRELARPGSSFDWSKAIKRVVFTQSELSELEDLLAERATRRDADALVAVGEQWLDMSETTRALASAAAALEVADDNSWGYMWGSTRRDVHALAIRAGGDGERQRAWNDLAAGLAVSHSRADSVLRDLEPILEVLDPSVSPVDLWPLFREYLDGMAETLDLNAEDPLVFQPIRWWYPGTSANVKRFRASDSAAGAIAALIVDHATHPQWMIRDPAITTIASGLRRGFSELESAISAVVAASPVDDLAEPLGRAVRASGLGSAHSTALAEIHGLLGERSNHFIRALSDSPDERDQPLPGRYRLEVPGGGAAIIGASDLQLAFYEDVVRFCAERAGLDDDMVVEHALLMMRKARSELPTDEEARAALAAAGPNFLLPFLYLITARSVAGSVVRDFSAAGYLDDLGGEGERLLRSFDPGLVALRPGPRPSLVPPAPPAGHETTLERWIETAPTRLDEYVVALSTTEGYVVAANAHATVLNWPNAEEQFICNTLIGERSAGDHPRARPPQVRNMIKSDLTKPVPALESVERQSLAIENLAPGFHQVEAAWISFSPALASHLGWSPVASAPGSWVNRAGELAVQTIEWVDGWPGHGDRAFDDTEGRGTIVLATPVGVRDLASLGPLTRAAKLFREGRDGTGDPAPADSTREERVELIHLVGRA